MKTQTVLRGAGVLLLLAIVSAVFSLAQVSTTGISGVVQDSTGAVVPNASIIATQTETNYTAKTVSGAAGEFTLTSMPVGPYKLTVTAAGFAPYTQTGIILKVAQVSDVRVSLKVDSVAQQVEVAADQAAVQTSEATVQTVVPEEIVQDLPLNGRQTNELLYTVPGVSDATTNVNPATSTTTGQGSMIPGSVSPSTHGVVSGSTYFALDGANNIDPYAMLGAPFPNPDATQEFNVATSTYGARYISAPGGAVNVVTKSGTNRIHGSAFEYIRNGFFNADQWGSTKPDELKRNQFGGSLGGPIIKNKWFIFGSYQETLSSDANAEQFQLPTVAERSGTFTTANPLTGEAGPPVDAGTLGFISGIINHPNFISGVSPTMGNLMTEYMPLPNFGDIYKVNVPQKTNTYEYIIKSEYVFGTHRIFGRYFRDHNLSPIHTMTSQDMDSTIGGKLNMFTESGGQRSFWETAALGDTWTKKNWVVDTRVSFNKGNADNLLDPTTEGITMPMLGAANLSVGLQGGTGLQIIGAAAPTFAGIVSEYAGTPRETWDLSEDITTIKGKHEITFGGSYRRLHYAEVNYAGQSGVFIYVGATSSILFGILGGPPTAPVPPYGGLVLNDGAVDDYVLGSPFITIQHDGFFVGANQNVVGFYAEDKYRMTQRLTVTGGVRWDPYLPIVTQRSQMTCWVPGEQSAVYTNAPKGLVFPGDPGCSQGGTSNKAFNIQPRVGIAYDPFGKGKTSIRGGYGIYYMQEQLQVMLGMSNPPWIRNYQVQQPFQSIDNVWASNGLGADPFGGGQFHTAGYMPTSTVAFPGANSYFATAGIANNYTPGYIQQWTLSVQQGIGGHDIVQIAYVGTKGTHLGASFDENLPALYPTGLPDPIPPFSQPSDNARRPDQSFGQIAVLKSNANSNYNALEASLNHQMQWGLFLNTSFSWAKCITEVSSPAETGGVSNYPVAGSSVDTGKTQYGLCGFDQNFTWRTNANWQLPSFSKENMLVRQVLGKWTASGLFSIEANTPFSIGDGNDRSGSGVGADRVDLATPAQPAWIPNTGPGPKKMLNYAAFTDNASGTYGNSGINHYRDVNHKDLDFALMKDFPIREQFKAAFRAEVFNLANHANYNPTGAEWSAGPGQFGKYLSAGPTRVMQFALRLEF